MDLAALHPLPTDNARAVSTADKRLRDAARELEATFISEMLKHTGIGEVSGSFGGGAGEEQFASLLRDAQARELAVSGGFGLAESIFEALKEQVHEN